MGRSTQGVKLVALKAKDNLIAVQKIETVAETNGETATEEPVKE